MLRAAILTVSDSAAAGTRRDESGARLESLLAAIPARLLRREVVPDEVELIAGKIRALSRQADVILTTGGTGVSPRDVTPEATRKVVSRTLPGFGEAMRAASLSKTPHAMISRALAGVCGKALVINLPGSPRGAEECLRAVLPAILHAVEKLQGDATPCADSARQKVKGKR